MSRKSRRTQKSQISEIYRNRKRNIAIVILVAFCLFIIYKINFLTKSEETIPLTSVKFVEYGTDNILKEDLQMLEDENGTYIILPEKVQGLYSQKYYVLNSSGEETSNQNENTIEVNGQDTLTENTSNLNTTIENVVEEIENKIENTSVQSVNKNQVETNSLFDKAVGANQKNFMAPSEVSKTAEAGQENSSEDTKKEENGNEEQNSNTVVEENKKEESDNQNKITENVVTDNNSLNENTNTVGNETEKNNVQSNEIQSTNTIDSKNDTTNTKNEAKKDEVKNETQSNLVLKEEKAKIDGTSYLPGEKIYFDKKILDSNSVQISVEYQTVDINGLKLYKQELNAEDDASNIKVIGYIPLGNSLEIQKEDPNIYEQLKADVEEISDSKVLFAYDIKITDGNKYYQPKEYYQNVNVSITAKTQLESKFSESLVQVLHIVEDKEQNQIEFQKVAITNKTDDSLEIITNEFSTYIVTALASSVTENQVFIYDYESDKNYYTGKNYTDNVAGTNQKIYTDDNLAQVTINYYSYDKDFEVGKTINLNKTSWNTSGTTKVNNSLYTHTVELTVTSPDNQFIDLDSPWEMTFSVPNNFLSDETLSRNNGKISNLSVSGNNVTFSNSSFANWNENSAKSYTLSFTLAFSTNTVANNPSTFKLEAVNKQLIGYVSAEERQNLFTYVKCVPIVGGDVSIELIDNPYMDRPKGTGFDGWITKEDHTITIDNDTKLQTLVAHTNGNKELTINVYANWREANVVFVSSSGRNDNTGLTPNSPKATFAQAATLLSSNRKTATNASDRELNIVVLTNGTFNNFSDLNNAGAYTLTSLYAGIDYRNQSLINFRQSLTINYDLQLDFVNIYGYINSGWNDSSASYVYDTATSNIDYYLCGNTKNLRIGRGMLPYNANSNVATFAQVQGGPNGSASRAYRLVIESGKYANIQLGRAEYYNSYTSNGNLVLGCDLDRISENNSNLQVYHRIASRTGNYAVTPSDNTKPVFLMIIKSGSIGMDNFIKRGTEYTYCGVYLGGHGSSNSDNGDRYLIVEGGNIANIIGGLMLQRGTSAKTFIFVKGGSIQNIVGGAGRTKTYGNRIIQVTGGSVEYSISGGSNGVEANGGNDTGELEGNTLIYIGGNCIIGKQASTNTLYNVESGCVLGAGNGNTRYSACVDYSHIIIDGNAIISNNVYGGGNYGYVGETSDTGTGGTGKPLIEITNKTNNIVSGEKYLITNGTRLNSSLQLVANGNGVTGKTLTDTTIPSATEEWIVERSGTGYALKNASTGRYLTIVQNAGWNGRYTYELTTTTSSSVFNYSNNRLSMTFTESSRWGGDRNVTYYLTGNNTWSASTNATNISFLQYTKIPQETPDEPIDPEPLATKTIIDIFGGTIGNDVYGGANQNNIYGSVDINMYNGIINGTMYGGSNTKGTIYGMSDINIEGGTIGNVDNLKDILFAGGKGKDTLISQHAKINITDNSNNLFLYGDIYGGSALGEVRNNSYITVTDTKSETNAITLNGNIYGGGKGDTGTAAINGANTTVTVDGGDYINAKAFGGCNINGAIKGSVLVKIGENNKTIIDEVYGGGNQASITTNSQSDYVYLYKNATVNNAFNGGNSAGIDGDNATTPRAIYSKGATIIEGLYGGSNSSGTLIETHVYVSEQSNISSVYGGGYGEDTRITENTDVDVENSKVRQVFGGGNAGIVKKNTNIMIDTSEIDDSVYGGGKSAEVSGTTTVNVENSTANEIYGGGENGKVTDNSTKATNVYINDTTANYVYGGGKGETAIVNGNTNTEIISTDKTTTINNNVYGGGNAGEVEKNTLVTIIGSHVSNSVYGGGNQAGVTGMTTVAIEDSTINEVYGGGNQGEVNETTSVSIISTNILDSVYGGGNQGEVKGNTTVMVSNQNTTDLGNVPEVKDSIYGGGKAANVNGTTVNLTQNAKTQNVYGGGDQGEVNENTNVKIVNSTIEKDVFGGGNGAEIAEAGKYPGRVQKNTNIDISASEGVNTTANKVFGGGKGITAYVNGNTSVVLKKGTQILVDTYGGGDNGYVNGSTSVELKSPEILGSVYAAGNGSKAIVYGNSQVYSEGTTIIGENLYGGGNAAETGDSKDKKSKSTVDIAGLNITGNVFGGANSSVINGDSIINIGIDAIDNYYGTSKGYQQGDINIGGTVYGGGYSMNPNSDKWDDSAISVTNTITINLFGDKYDEGADSYTLNIKGSIFGSGNASNAAQDGNLLIKNWGTESSRKKLVSIQRCTLVTLEKSVLILSGVKDSTSEYKETLFTFNKIADLQLKGGTILYLRNGANRLSKFESLNEDGTYATVDVSDTEFKVTNLSTDNRIYMANGINLNVCYGDPQKLEVGPVKGMTFFGIFKSAPAGSSDPDGIYKGIYDQSYVTGDLIDDYNSREFLRTYVYGEHTKVPEEQDITKDGFYTNMESLSEGYEYGNISPDNFSAKSYTYYIEPTPTGDYSYYYWYAGPDQEIYTYDIELVASKFSTFGSVENPFSDMNFPDAVLEMSSVDSSGLLNSDIELVSKNDIDNISDDANLKFGLLMKTGNTGWSNRGSAEFYKDSYNGDQVYQFENANTTPAMSFYLYHSNNITEDANLGTYRITMNLTYWKADGLNRGTALVVFNIQLFTKKYEGLGYNAAIAPGTQYDLFTASPTNITTKSSFSVYFELGEKDFFKELQKVIDDSGITVPDDYYEKTYRVISTGEYVLPANATITMIDRYDKNNPSYYYYTISEKDEKDKKKLFKLDEFLVMGSTDKHYSEAEMRKKYYLTTSNYQYENFIFIVNLENADYSSYADGTKITPDNNYFEMFLRLDNDVNGEKNVIDLVKIINDQKDTTGYGIFQSSSTIDVKASLSKSKIYLGNDVTLNVKTIYNANTQTATVVDTRYFDKKLGIKLTFFYKNPDGNYVPVTGASMLGTYFGINRNLIPYYYFPRADGTTRIKLAELVSNGSSAISLITKNSNLETGEYRILVESFGSADGIYFGIEASASDTVDMQIINDVYGLKVSLDEERQAVIDSKTGQVADNKGYTSEIQYNENTVTDVNGNEVVNKEEILDNKIKFNLEYQSGLSNPYVTVSLYRRNYDAKDTENPDLYDRTYSLVDLKDYVSNSLILPTQILSTYDENNEGENQFINSLKKLDKEYEALNTTAIKNKVSDNTVSVTFDNLEYELKKMLKTGTYKVVFTLYDTTDTTAKREIKDDEGNITSVKDYNVREYEKIGEAFSYIIIK